MKINKYVYLYLDPRKTGRFTYEELGLTFLYEPFYVGKGTNRRKFLHLTHARNYYNENTFKERKIRKIWKEGLDPIILEVAVNLSDKDAKELEVQIVNSIKRFPAGPLTNLTDGGEGTSGMTYKHTKEWKRLMSEKRTGMKFPKWWVDKLKSAQLGEKHWKSKTYIITTSEGEQQVVKGGLKRFCKENNLPHNTLYRYINKGKIPLPPSAGLKNKGNYKTEEDVEKRLKVTNWQITSNFNQYSRSPEC